MARRKPLKVSLLPDGSNPLQLSYEADGEILRRYLADSSRVCGIMGPRNSGKSTASIIKLYQNALHQPTGSDGWKRRRSLVIRHTYGNLEHTTIKSWQIWFPPDVWGDIRMTHPPVHHIKVFPLDWEVIFIALDKPEHIKHLNSRECSDAWVNEAWEVAREIISPGLILTTGRFPNPMSKEGCYRPQVLFDTNGPPLGHWINYMAGLEVVPPSFTEQQKRQSVLPEGWAIHMQPPGLIEHGDEAGDIIGYEENPEAENARWRAPGYYLNAVDGASPETIQRYAMGRPGGATTGHAVWKEFREHIHVAKSDLAVVPGSPIIIGMDFGRTPAAVFCQKPFDRRWFVLGEIDGVEISARGFADEWVLPFLGRMIETVDPGGDWEWQTIIYPDPAGEHDSEATDTTPIKELRSAVKSQARVIPALAGQYFTIRRDTLNAMWRQMVDGKPLITIDRGCKSLIRAAAGGYCYPVIQRHGGNELMVGTRPDKRNVNTHIANALEYAITGHDKGAIVLTGSGRMSLGAVKGVRPPGYFLRLKQERMAAQQPVVVPRQPGGFFARRRQR